MSCSTVMMASFLPGLLCNARCLIVEQSIILKKAQLNGLLPCERARINKKTFYRYYETLDYLLEEVMATYAAAWRRRTTHLHMPDDLAEITREFFHFGAEQDALYEAITCDPEWDVIQRRMQDDASGERQEQVPDGWDPDRWHVFYAYQSAAVLAMYRAWVSDGKAIPVEEMAELAADLVCKGATGIA
ncbi:MAG: hypothetical protein J6S63_07435, partial [Atopobiaceae bacterium]|nr:hypothetical protein [Atopobiaceae bacterium]